MKRALFDLVDAVFDDGDHCSSGTRIRRSAFHCRILTRRQLLRSVRPVASHVVLAKPSVLWHRDRLPAGRRALPFVASAGDQGSDQEGSRRSARVEFALQASSRAIAPGRRRHTSSGMTNRDPNDPGSSRPRSEPEIIPPGQSGRNDRGIWVSVDDNGGPRRVFVARPGPFTIILALAVLGADRPGHADLAAQRGGDLDSGGDRPDRRVRRIDVLAAIPHLAGAALTRPPIIP